MLRVERGGTVFYTSTLFPSHITHAITTRHGGVSPTPYDTLNMSAHVGDDPANPPENLARVHGALGLEAGTTVDAIQAQADRVAVVGAKQRGTRVADVDALITNVPGVPLMLRFADCVPILFYDRTRHAIGIAHAGWRGTVGKVAANTVQTMRENFGSEPQDLVACIGPSIGPCCYEIGADVRARVAEAFGNANELLIRRNGSTYLDLWEANASQLRALGLGEVEVSGICTADHTDDFYSWRREHAHTGRFAAIIALGN